MATAAPKSYIEGIPQLNAKLAKLAKSVRDDMLQQATAAGAKVIADQWRANVRATIGRGPGTAHYEDAIGLKAEPGKGGATAMVALSQPVPLEKNEAHPREYASHLEFNGHPTLRPAIDETRTKVLAAESATIQKLLKEGR